MLACPAASRTRLFDSSCVVEARPRKAYGERNRCNAGFHDSAKSTSFNSLHVFGRSITRAPFVLAPPTFPAALVLLLPLLATYSPTDTDDETLRQDPHQRRDGCVDSAGHRKRFASHDRVVSLPGNIGRRQPHEPWQRLHLRADAGDVMELADGKARTDRSDKHTVTPHFMGERFGELDEERLCRSIQRVTGGRRHQARKRRDVDDATIAPFDHPR